jgi:hypothetical protein
VPPAILKKNAAIPTAGVTATALAWRFKGVLQVTVVAKATFAFAADGPAVRGEPQPIFADEVHHGKRANQSIRFASDHAIYLTRAEVFLTGHAHAPQGASIEQMPVRLGVFDGARLVLDKTVLIRKKGGFQKIPLVYERAFGGMGFSDNPFGVGATDASEEPNILDLADARRAAGFGPIAASWPARRGLLGEMPRKLLKAPVVELPDNFDWAYFQAAPADQRVDFFRGDEWIVIDGVSPTRPRVRTRLPGARGLARVHGLSSFGIAEGQPLALHADTLRIDADEERITLSFRGVFPVPSDEALEALNVTVGVETPGHPVAWPNMTPVDETSTIDVMDDMMEEVSGPALAGTLMLGAEEIAPALPFQAGASPLAKPGPREPLPLADAVGTGTLFVGDMDELPALATDTMAGGPDFPEAPALPFQPGYSAYAQPSRRAAAPPPDPMSGATLMDTPEDGELLRTLPFTTHEAPPPLPAPMSPARTPSAPPAPVVAPEPEEQVARWIPPPAAPEPPPPPPAEAKKPAGSPWAPAPEAAPAPAPPPKPPPPQGPPAASTALKKGVYGRLGKR